MGIVISVPRAKMGTKASVISTLITAIIMTVMAVVFLFPVFGSKEFEVTQSFDVSTQYYSGGDYKMTITGEVKNTTSETMYNVYFYVTAENDEYYVEADMDPIAEIGPGEIVRVQGEFLVDEVYTMIGTIEYSIDGGSLKTLAQGDEWIASIALGAFGLIMWIIFFVSLAKYKKKKGEVETQFGGNTFGGPVSTNDGTVVSNPFATNPQPTAPAPTATSAQTCPYCGSKVQATDGKCPGCGAKL